MQYHLKWATMLALVLLLMSRNSDHLSFQIIWTWSSLSLFCKLYIFLYLRLLLPYLRVVASNKRYNIQRRLAWSLCKDDTHNRREAKTFFCLFAPLHHCLDDSIASMRGIRLCRLCLDSNFIPFGTPELEPGSALHYFKRPLLIERLTHKSYGRFKLILAHLIWISRPFLEP